MRVWKKLLAAGVAAAGLATCLFSGMGTVYAEDGWGEGKEPEKVEVTGGNAAVDDAGLNDGIDAHGVIWVYPQAYSYWIPYEKLSVVSGDWFEWGVWTTVFDATKGWKYNAGGSGKYGDYNNISNYGYIDASGGFHGLRKKITHVTSAARYETLPIGEFLRFSISEPRSVGVENDTYYGIDFPLPSMSVSNGAVYNKSTYRFSVNVSASKVKLARNYQKATSTYSPDNPTDVYGMAWGYPVNGSSPISNTDFVETDYYDPIVHLYGRADTSSANTEVTASTSTMSRDSWLEDEKLSVVLQADCSAGVNADPVVKSRKTVSLGCLSQSDVTFDVPVSGSAQYLHVTAVTATGKKVTVTKAVPAGVCITHDAQGGTVNGKASHQGAAVYPGSEAEVYYGATRKNYAFTGWYTQPGGKGQKYSQGDKIALSQNITLYAGWEKVTPVFHTEFSADKQKVRIGDKTILTAKLYVSGKSPATAVGSSFKVVLPDGFSYDGQPSVFAEKVYTKALVVGGSSGGTTSKQWSVISQSRNGKMQVSGQNAVLSPFGMYTSGETVTGAAAAIPERNKSDTEVESSSDSITGDTGDWRLITLTIPVTATGSKVGALTIPATVSSPDAASVTANASLTVEGWKIMASAVHGTVTGQKDNIPQGGSCIVTYKPDDGYYVKEVLLDGKAISSHNMKGGTYEFKDIRADHTLTVKCEKLLKVETHITHGTITGTDDRLYPGDNKTVTYSPDKNYYVKSVTVDGKKYALKEVKPYLKKYEVKNIQKDVSITVECAKIPEVTLEASMKGGEALGEAGVPEVTVKVTGKDYLGDSYTFYRRIKTESGSGRVSGLMPAGEWKVSLVGVNHGWKADRAEATAAGNAEGASVSLDTRDSDTGGARFTLSPVKKAGGFRHADGETNKLKK